MFCFKNKYNNRVSEAWNLLPQLNGVGIESVGMIEIEMKILMGSVDTNVDIE